MMFGYVELPPLARGTELAKRFAPMQIRSDDHRSEA
jgi:hypothetical protein